jgi:hypothetical protein
MMTKAGTLILVAFALLSCQPEIRVPDFEPQKWKEDTHGCNGDRQKLLATLLKHRGELIGQNQQAVKTLLGKPDAMEVGSRGLKFFEYGVKGGNLCHPGSLEQPEILRIRFDALDRANEVAIY